MHLEETFADLVGRTGGQLHPRPDFDRRQGAREAAKDQVRTFAAEKMKEQASAIIPGPFQSKAGEIIDKAAEKLADKAIAEAKKVAGI